eukprot:CAMPEP_0181116804 /NCGR_PEP_ID=MMETSP1071-20121207/22150_1 /TAXON_ID=35127 /ORGANISM="Thalassiosira sp., Strain NH16" /LENGTH=600 /DNA_ID=CAMNT_0023201081 /DNA_START=165 /DNA_END=1967 /DNA_ORIENTATION=+
MPKPISLRNSINSAGSGATEAIASWASNLLAPVRGGQQDTNDRDEIFDRFNAMRLHKQENDSDKRFFDMDAGVSVMSFHDEEREEESGASATMKKKWDSEPNFTDMQQGNKVNDSTKRNVPLSISFRDLLELEPSTVHNPAPVFLPASRGGQGHHPEHGKEESRTHQELTRDQSRDPQMLTKSPTSHAKDEAVVASSDEISSSTNDASAYIADIIELKLLAANQQSAIDALLLKVRNLELANLQQSLAADERIKNLEDENRNLSTRLRECQGRDIRSRLELNSGQEHHHLDDLSVMNAHDLLTRLHECQGQDIRSRQELNSGREHHYRDDLSGMNADPNNTLEACPDYQKQFEMLVDALSAADDSIERIQKKASGAIARDQVEGGATKQKQGVEQGVTSLDGELVGALAIKIVTLYKLIGLMEEDGASTEVPKREFEESVARFYHIANERVVDLSSSSSSPLEERRIQDLLTRLHECRGQEIRSRQELNSWQERRYRDDLSDVNFDPDSNNTLEAEGRGNRDLVMENRTLQLRCLEASCPPSLDKKILDDEAVCRRGGHHIGGDRRKHCLGNSTITTVTDVSTDDDVGPITDLHIFRYLK